MDKVGVRLLLAFCVGVGIYMATKTPRGIRNNNPGNIRHGENWQGMTEAQTDSAFIQFVSPEYGIRAMTRILNTYRVRYGLNTINGVIARWAPPTENNTGAYVLSVAQSLQIKPSDVIKDDEVPYLIMAIIKHENGQQPYTLQTILRGIELA